MKKKLLKNIPVLLIALFEIVIGVLLFIHPQGFTKAMIAVFGVGLIVVGVIHLVKYIKDRKNGTPGALSLTVAVIVILVGILATFFPNVLYERLESTFAAVIYAVMLVIAGVYKIGLHIDYRTDGDTVNFMHMVSGIVSIVLGAVIMFRPFGTNEAAMWITTGILIICVAGTDIASIVLNFVLGKKSSKGNKTPEVVSEG